MLQFFKFVFLTVLLAGISSCATILGGRANTLVFESPQAQPAEIFLDGERIGQAPGKIKLPAHQIQHGSQLLIQADGFQPSAYTILRRPDPVYVAADVVSTLGVALAVDFIDGQIYRPRPRKFVYVLEKNQ